MLGPDPFDGILEDTLLGREEQGRPFQVVRARSLADLPPCHILFIAYPEAGARQDVLKRVQGQPVLTVSDASDFLAAGGMVQFRVDSHVGLGINLDAAREASLEIQTKMLEVAYLVLEDGGTRWRR